jgi:hypothetical protein
LGHDPAVFQRFQAKLPTFIRPIQAQAILPPMF